MRRILSAAVLYVALVLPVANALAASAPPAPQLPVMKVPLVAWVTSRQHARPETLEDFTVAPTRVAQFRALLESILNENWSQAVAQGKSLAYLLVAIEEAGNWFIVASDDSNTGRDPTVVINMNPRRDFVVEAPHVPFEPGTGEEAIIFLKELAGRAALVSGAHRCASRSFTACDGRTAVCAGASQGYRDSEVGHNVDTLFHAAHVVFAQRWPAAIFISLHGMREDAGGVRTSLIISNGIRADDAAAQTAATKVRIALSDWIKQPGRVVSCNFPDDAVYDYRKLCGYTNVQGRQVNGGADACHGSVDQGSGRFIHIEQDWTVLRPYARSGRQKGTRRFGTALMRALARVLPRVQAP